MSPWPHLVVDDFLENDVLARALTDISGAGYRFDMEVRGSGRIEYSLLESEVLWRAVYSRNTTRLLNAAFGVKLALDKGNMLQLRRMNAETPEFPRHNDNVAGAKTIATFLYLSGGLAADCGGRLCLYKSEDDDSDRIFVEPRPNRLVAFETSLDHWHSVESASGWERLSVLALWNVIGTH